MFCHKSSSDDKNKKSHHLSDLIEAFAMEGKGLLKECSVLLAPFIRERCEVGELPLSCFKIISMPEEHTQSLLWIISILLLRQSYVSIH